MAAVALIVSVRGCWTYERLSHLSVDPEVSIFVEGKPPVAKVCLYNAGPIAVSCLSVSRFTVLAGGPFNRAVVKDGKSIEADPEGRLWRFVETLSPRQTVSGEFGCQGVTSKGIVAQIGVHIYDSSYYRPSDLKEYRKRIFFFDDGTAVYTHTQFREHPLYAMAMKTVSTVQSDPEAKLFERAVKNLRDPVAHDN